MLWTVSFQTEERIDGRREVGGRTDRERYHSSVRAGTLGCISACAGLHARTQTDVEVKEVEVGGWRRCSWSDLQPPYSTVSI